MSREIENQKTSAAAKDWDAEIAKMRARLNMMQTKKSKAQRTADTRKKILAGIAILKAMEDDKDLRLTALPAMHHCLSDVDSATLKGLMGEQK